MEGPSEKNVWKHEEHDNDGVVASSPLIKGKDNEKSAPNQTKYGDLVAGLGNEIILGEVITRLPWYQRPILTVLSKSWAHSMTHSFPCYAHLHHPRILSKLIVLYRRPRCKTPCNPREDLALWAYDCHHRRMRNLPVPAIPVDLQQRVKFVCDDNDESIYSFTCVHEKRVYDVQVLDLREGGCSPWKRLPSLPIHNNDDSEYYIYRCSSTLNENCSITYIVYMRNNFMEEDPYAFFQWEFTVTENENDCERKLWQCQCLRSSPFVFSAEEKPPLYVEINKVRSLCGRRFSEKYLYQRCKRLDDNEPPYERWGSGYVLMQLFQEDTVGQPAYSFYEIRLNENRFNEYGVKFYKMMLEDAESSRRIVEDAEGAPFWDFWRSWIDDDDLMEEGEQRSAIQISTNDMVLLGKGEGNGNNIDIGVAQRSHSLYLYRLISF